MKTKRGIHTFSLTARSTYTEIQNIVEQVPCISRPDKYHLNIKHEIVKYKGLGVEIHLHQSLVHPSWIKLIVNPSSLLAGEYRPTKLFHKLKKLPQLKQALGKILKECCIERQLKEFKLARVDLTEDRYHNAEEDVLSEVERFQKSFFLPPYKVVPLGNWSQNAISDGEADRHSWTIGCKSCAFSVYDKTYELARRHNVNVEDPILRRELRLERKRVTRLTKKNGWEQQLEELLANQEKIMGKFLRRLHHDCERVVSPEAARRLIDGSSCREKTKQQLRKLVELSIQHKTLEEIRKRMRLSRKKFTRLLDRCRKLDFNPITQETRFFQLKRFHQN